MKKVKLTQWLLCGMLFSTLLSAFSCEDDIDLTEERFVYSNGDVPESKYLTTIPTSYFQSNIEGCGWEMRNIYVIHAATGTLKQFSPVEKVAEVSHHLYFSGDSLFVFKTKNGRNVYTGKPYHYAPERNLVRSEALPYLQIEEAGDLWRFPLPMDPRPMINGRLLTVEYLFTESSGKKIYGLVLFDQMTTEEVKTLFRFYAKEN